MKKFDMNECKQKPDTCGKSRRMPNYYVCKAGDWKRCPNHEAFVEIRE